MKDVWITTEDAADMLCIKPGNFGSYGGRFNHICLWLPGNLGRVWPETVIRKAARLRSVHRSMGLATALEAVTGKAPRICSRRHVQGFAPVDTDRQAETALAGSGRSLGSAVTAKPAGAQPGEVE